MKRIIITERQYKKLVNKPLNEEITDSGEKVTDFDIELEGYIIRRWNDNNPEHVERIQKMLKSLNYDLGYYGENGDGVDGIYGRFTEKAVEEFQENEMPNQPEQWDGIIGPITYEILKDSVKGLADEEGVEDDDLLNNDDVEEGDDVEEFEFHGEGLTDEIPTILHELMYLISSKESKNHSYDSAYPSKIIPGLSEMTIEEATSVNGSSAVGRWQFMPKYMVDRVKKVGLKMSDKFSEVNQDKMAMSLIKGWGRLSCEKFAQKLARIWAAVPVLYDQKGNKRQIKRGQSYYEGVQGNSAGIGADEFEAAVRKTGCDGDIYKELEGSKICGVKPYTTTSDLNKIKFYQIPNSTNFRSGQPTLPQLAYILETYDIKHIVRMNGDNETSPVGKTKVTWDKERKMAECYGVEFHFINAHKPRYGKKIDGVNLGYTKSMEEIQPYLEEGNTLIHCRNGSDRTGYQVAKYLQNRGMTDQQSLWDYTTNYNGWCEQSTEKFGSGYDTYAQGFVNGLDEKMRQELCG